MKMLESHYKAITAHIHPTILRELVPVDITPSAKWFLSESEQEHWNYSDDFPCLVPPSPVTWLEFELPTVIQSSERRVENHTVRRSGAFCLTFEIEADSRDGALDQDLLLRYMQMLDGRKREDFNWAGSWAERQTHMLAARDGGLRPRWISVWNILAEPMVGPLLGLGLYGMYLDEQGRNMAGLNSCITALTPPMLARLPADYDIFADALPFMFALSLTHCKNVSMSELPVAPAVAKKRLKKGIASFTFRVLDIKPMRRQMQQVGERKGGSESKRAMHFVRAHFKTFSADKPLFGRHSGTYWWQLSVRGEAEAGIAAKQYRVPAI